MNRGPYGEAKTLDCTFKDVITPNADTPYSFGLLDLLAGTVVLTVPEVAGRYYVMQIEDLLGFNELFVGSRATGTAPGSYLLMVHDGRASCLKALTPPFNSRLISCSYSGVPSFWVTEDQSALADVMKQYRIEPLHVFLGGSAPALKPFDWPV